MAKNKYYVVWSGHQPGIFDNWPAAQRSISGYANARYKGFSNLAEAEAAFAKGAPKAPARNPAAARTTTRRSATLPSSNSIIYQSLSVDAACSGNPGVMEYQGVDTRTRERIFHQRFDLGTNNIGEFLAIVHGLALLQKQGLHDMPIYTDSATAMKWIRQGKAKTTLVKNRQTAQLYQMIERAEQWLATNTFRNPLLKWQTETWGEIPADFGRK